MLLEVSALMTVEEKKGNKMASIWTIESVFLSERIEREEPSVFACLAFTLEQLGGLRYL